VLESPSGHSFLSGLEYSVQLQREFCRTHPTSLHSSILHSLVFSAKLICQGTPLPQGSEVLLSFQVTEIYKPENFLPLVSTKQGTSELLSKSLMFSEQIVQDVHVAKQFSSF